MIINDCNFLGLVTSQTRHWCSSLPQPHQEPTCLLVQRLVSYRKNLRSLKIFMIVSDWKFLFVDFERWPGQRNTYSNRNIQDSRLLLSYLLLLSVTRFGFLSIFWRKKLYFFSNWSHGKCINITLTPEVVSITGFYMEPLQQWIQAAVVTILNNKPTINLVVDVFL